MASPSVSLQATSIEDVVARIVDALEGGGAVVLPTDTVYGLAALPADPAATQRLFELKGRAADTPLAVLCADVDQAVALVDPSVAAVVHAVGERWWPGPLTLVVRRRSGLALHLGEPVTTVGVRVPDHRLVRAVAARAGPIAATSANPHGRPTPATAEEAAASLGPGVALVVDGGRLSARASTVIDATDDPWVVLREGPVPADDVLELARTTAADGDR